MDSYGAIGTWRRLSGYSGKVSRHDRRSYVYNLNAECRTWNRIRTWPGTWARNRWEQWCVTFPREPLNIEAYLQTEWAINPTAIAIRESCEVIGLSPYQEPVSRFLECVAVLRIVMLIDQTAPDNARDEVVNGLGSKSEDINR